ncbi:peptidase T [Selenomonas sp. AB3002]|uniref:peptidase T n=1 Tax=Selenomonas sp. AB3002 TaxID=1392502 RepID=UPI000494F4E4
MEISMDVLVKRFKDYVSFDSQSSEENDQVCPSTPGQMVLAKHLAEELKALGLEEVTLDNHGYIMATLPASGCEGAPVVGFIAHMDTSPDASGADIKPQVVENYDGGDIVLNKEQDIRLSPKDFPSLLKYKGQPIMTTDGTTLLGADDKAGVTAIVSAVEYLLQHPEIKHGKIRLGFTPDEETGRSADRFDVKAFGADFAYTVDGDELGSLEYENFNAANAAITFKGRSVHTGDAKGKMINANTVACEWQQMLPAGERPEYTEGYEGFYHVHKVSGDVEKVTMMMLIRDHDKAKFARRKSYLEELAALLNKKYGEGTVTVDCKDMYLNMREKMEEAMYVVELAEKAMESAGVKPVVKPIRGGTDGARLSFMGLPCPNLFTGGTNFHGRFEYLPLLSLQKAAETVLAIMTEAGKLRKH